MKSRLIVSSCGTSVLTNGLDDERRRLFNVLTNLRENELEQDQRQAIVTRAQEVEERLRTADLNSVRRLSAELNGILGLYGGVLPASSADQHCLLCTDTCAGRTAAGIIERWMRDHGLLVALHPIKDLNTRSVMEFHSGIHNVISWCEDWCREWKERGHDVIFNLVGGFKAMQSYLTVLGMFYATESVYIFETGEELLRIPRLPVTLNPEHEVRQHVPIFRRMGLGEEVPEEEVRAIAPTLVETLDGRASLSVWGNLVWKEWKRKLYQEQLWDPPCEKIRYSVRFKDDAAKYAGGPRMMQINDKIDNLCRYRMGYAQNLASLDFKKLRGDPAPPSTHECDAWSDGDARRILCHFEGDTLVLDRISPHL